MTEPVSLDELKVHLRLTPDETGEDDYLRTLITAARRACENTINRTIVGRSETLSLDAFPAPRRGSMLNSLLVSRDPCTIFLPGGTTSAVTGITYRDAAGATITVSPSAYVVDLVWQPARIDPVSSWPIARGQIRIAYTLSPIAADDMAVVAQAVKLLAGHWYVNRESVVADLRAVALPQSVEWLLEPLRAFAND